jgi:hypothetical protein
MESVMLGQDSRKSWDGFLRAVFMVACDKHEFLADRVCRRLEHDRVGPGKVCAQQESRENMQ